ncbi:MAG: hypothetical protein CL937_06025 [Deltaproteobacteria bacterium]|nr:hypothetical protein [Deltaproteobacteria bacterium]OUV99188.1 MAG: hypothetical protein CBD14_05820 [Proteobacteria bacterium TMED154]
MFTSGYKYSRVGTEHALANRIIPRKMKNLKMLEVKKNEGKSMMKSSFLFSAYTVELEEFFDKKPPSSIRG